MIKHLVLFQLKAQYEESDYDALLEGFRALSVMPFVRNLSFGKDISHRGPFNFALSCDMETEEQLREYAVHPAHVHLIRDLLPKVEEHREVVDFSY